MLKTICSFFLTVVIGVLSINGAQGETIIYEIVPIGSFGNPSFTVDGGNVVFDSSIPGQSSNDIYTVTDFVAGIVSWNIDYSTSTGQQSVSSIDPGALVFGTNNINSLVRADANALVFSPQPAPLDESGLFFLQDDFVMNIFADSLADGFVALQDSSGVSTRSLPQGDYVFATSTAIPIFEHSGANDPLTEGWSQEGSGVDVTTGQILNDLGSGIDSWFVRDPSTVLGSSIQYSQTPTVATNTLAAQSGWKLTANLRLVESNVGAVNGMFVDYRNGKTSYLMSFDRESDGDPTVALGGGGSFTLQGVGDGDYHLYELIFKPAFASADLLVDGVEVLSGHVGQPSTLNRVNWGAAGSDATGRGHFNSVKFETIPDLITIIGDVNLDGVVNLLDVAPFIDRLSTGTFQEEADVNQDGVVNLLDVDPFINILSG